MPPITVSYIKEKWKHEGFQKYLRNTGWMLVSRILSMSASFLTTIIIVRKLGPENFGQLSYAVSFVSIFSILATLGIDNVLYRDLIKNPDKKREFLGSALFIKLLAGSFTALLIIISTIFWGENDVSKLLILILSGTFVFNAFQVINYEFQARVESKYPAIASLVITIILSIVKIILIFSGKGVIYLAFVLLLESLLYSIFYWVTYERKFGGKILELKFDKKISVSLLTDSWPIIFTSAFVLIYSRIDQILIKYLMDASSVGLYAAAVAIAEVWYFIPNIIMSSVFPAILNAQKTSVEIYHERIKKLSLLLLILAVSVASVTTIFAPLIIRIIYGDAFIPAATVLIIYVWAGVGTSLGILATNYLIAENKRKILAFMTFVPMVINVMLNLILIPKYGIEGSAYATLVSYMLGPISIMLFKGPRGIFLNSERLRNM